MKTTEIREGTRTYQIVKNNDKNLVDKIVNFKYKKLEVALTTTKSFEIAGTAESDDEGEEQYEMVITDPKLSYSKKTVDSMILDQKLNQINTEFNVAREFKNQYGILCNKNATSLKVVDLLDIEALNQDKSGVKPFGPFYEYSVVSTQGRETTLEYRFKASYEMLALYLDTDGNFKNRKYNLDLQNYESNSVPDPSYVYDHFKNELKQKLGETVKIDKNGIVYNDSFCVTHSVEEDRITTNFIPVRSNKVSYQISEGYHIYKLPKNLNTISIEEYINIIESKVVENKDVFTKRFN